MFALRPLPRFTRKYKKLVQRNQQLEMHFRRVFEQLAENPRSPALRSHKVTARDGRIAFSSEVTGDLRITWRYSQTEVEVIDLVDTGGHSGSKKVYR